MKARRTIGLFGELEQVVATTLCPTCLGLVATVGLVLAACLHRADVQCEQDANCDLSSGGLCVQASSGSHWCAYPDPTCGAGYRYAGSDVGDGIAGVCTQSGVNLHVMVGGSGVGTIVSVPAGITCSSGSCDGTFPVGTQVQLTATASSGVFLGWSAACKGIESCTVTMDRDQEVDALFGIPGQALWAAQLGGRGADLGAALAVDRDSNIIAVGDFAQTAQIGTTSLTSAGGQDLYVAKLDGATGAVIWAKRFGGSGNDTAASVSVDDANNVYVAGRFENAADFGAGVVTTAGASDAFLLKLSAGGDLGWVRAVGGAGFDNGLAVSAKSDRVVLTGIYTGSMVIDGRTLTSAGSADVFVYEVASADGAGKWSTSLGSGSEDSATSVAIDSSGNVVIGGTSHESATVVSMFITKLAAASGTTLFTKVLGSNADDTLSALTVDQSDNILVAGGYSGSLDLGNGTPVTATKDQDIFVAKYTLAGAYVWGRAFGGTGSEQGRAVAVNAAGDLVLAGDFEGTISFGGPSLSSASVGFTDAFVVRLAAADGSFLKSVRVGGMGTEEGDSVAVNPDGRFYVTGAFDGFAEFGGQALTPVGLNDSYVLAFAPL